MTIAEKVSRGIPLSDELIIDCHCHMGTWQNFHIPGGGTAKQMVDLMDRVGIRCCFPAAHAAIGPDFRYGNDLVLQAMADFPGRFHGYCTVNPNYPEKVMIAELERCCVAGPMRAVKFHPDCHQYPADGPGYRPAWEFANEHGLILLSHTSIASKWNPVAMFDSLAEKYPKVKILLGHSGFGYEGYKASAEMAARRPNVYCDLTGSQHLHAQIERMVAICGAEKVLFGTDLPFMDLRPSVGRLAFARISEEDKRKIFGLNMARIAGIAK